MVFRNAFFVAAACAVFAADGAVKYVDSFDLSGATCGLGKRIQPLKSVDGHELTASSNVYARGFGTRPESAPPGSQASSRGEAKDSALLSTGRNPSEEKE